MKRILFCLCALTLLFSSCASGALLDATELTNRLAKLDEGYALEAQQLLAQEADDGTQFFTFLKRSAAEGEPPAQEFLLKLYTEPESYHVRLCSLSLAAQTAQEGETTQTQLPPESRDEFLHLAALLSCAYTGGSTEDCAATLENAFPGEKQGVQYFTSGTYRYTLAENELGLRFSVENIRLNPTQEVEMSLRPETTALPSVHSP